MKNLKHGNPSRRGKWQKKLLFRPAALLVRARRSGRQRILRGCLKRNNLDAVSGVSLVPERNLFQPIMLNCKQGREAVTRLGASKSLTSSLLGPLSPFTSGWDGGAHAGASLRLQQV